MLAIVQQDGFGGDDGLSDSVASQGEQPLAALAALVQYLRRMRAVDELASFAAMVSPYAVTALRSFLSAHGLILKLFPDNIKLVNSLQLLPHGAWTVALTN